MAEKDKAPEVPMADDESIVPPVDEDTADMPLEPEPVHLTEVDLASNPCPTTLTKVSEPPSASIAQATPITSTIGSSEAASDFSAATLEGNMHFDPLYLMRLAAQGTIPISKRSNNARTSESSSTPWVIVFSKDLCTTVDKDLDCQIRDLMGKIRGHQEKLSPNQDSGLSQFWQWYENNSRVLGQLQEIEKAVDEIVSKQQECHNKLVTSSSELELLDKAMTAGSQSIQDVTKKIEYLEKQLAERKKQNLEEAYSQCDATKRDVILKVQEVSSTFIKAKFEVEEQSSRQKVLEMEQDNLRVPFESLKSSPPF